VTPPLADYALLGDTRVAALVDSDGSIDWLCLPRFDGPSTFGRLIGGPDAGHFRVGPSGPARLVSRRYRPGTPTMETTWACDGGRFTLTDGMVAEPSSRLLPTTMLVRRLRAEDGPVEASLVFDPRRGDDRSPPRRVRQERAALVCEWRTLALALLTAPHLDVTPGAAHTFTVSPGEDVTFVLSVAQNEPLVLIDPIDAWAVLQEDDQSWMAWSRDVDDDIPERDMVIRSLITLRLLTYSPSGASVAAPTTSLPEVLGGGRNWDYRFAWPRDASIGVAAFLGVGMPEEARRFMAWLLHASRLDRPRLPVLLTLDGRSSGRERQLADWPGYLDSRPVRVGNAAAGQHQLDGYGWVIDAAWLLESSGGRLYSETWRAVRGFADEVAVRWREPDAGIWEVRGDPAHHVHSKLMAWLALDRALRIGERHRLSARRRDRWQRARDAIDDDVRTHGVDPARDIYTRTYGSHDLDASVLVLPLVELEEPGSPRVAATIDAIRNELSAGGPLLYRYQPGTDGLHGTEGAFVPCSFWLVQALALTGRIDDARRLLADTLALASPLGLFAEEIDPATGLHLGNYPQALSHAAVVQAALAIRAGSG